MAGADLERVRRVREECESDRGREDKEEREEVKEIAIMPSSSPFTTRQGSLDTALGDYFRI